MVCLCRPLLIQWLAVCFQVARSQDPTQDFWATQVLSASYTGPANKDLGNAEFAVGAISGFGQQHATLHGTVLEHIWVEVRSWGQYLSCCPPYSITNPGDYYRCNSWTTEANDNCHTPNLPFNDGNVTAVGGKVVAGQKQCMYSFPSEGEGSKWFQGLARRVKVSDLAWYWVDQAGGCGGCQGKDIEDPCYGKCIQSHLSIMDLLELTNQALADRSSFPNYGIPGKDVLGILYWGDGKNGSGSKCLELSGGNSAYGTAIDLWDCNGLVNQAWSWGNSAFDLQIKLAGHNEPGMCIDLPGGQVYNGNPLWLWACSGTPEQQWEWDGDTNSIRTKLDWNYCIDLPSGDTTNGNHLWLWECNGGSSQKWQLWKAGQGDSGVQTPASYRSQEAMNKPAGVGSWMHEIKKWLTADLGSNLTMSADWVPWYEKKDVKDWYAAQLPTALPRPLVPQGWNGYNSTRTPLPKVNVLV